MNKLEIILTNLGFETREKQCAFLENLYFAGYFQNEKIWQMLDLSRRNKDGEISCNQERDIAKDFHFICVATNSSGANQENHQNFNSQILLDHLFQEESFDEIYVANLMLYMAQTAFARAQNQERIDLKKANWMDLYYAQYLENSAIIGLIEAIEPQPDEQFDELWVQGARRSMLLSRLMHAKELQDAGLKIDEIRLLTGEREMWAEIDSIGDVEECKQYMIELARRNNIQINEQEPFIEKTIAGATRTFINYADGETKKLTETMMAKDLYRQVFGVEILEKDVTNSAAQPDKLRPDTAKTAQDAAIEFLQQKLGQKELAKIKIGVLSNQPYAARQTLSVQRAVSEKIDATHISFFPVGKKCEAKLAEIHSELGALMAERYMFWQKQYQIKSPIPLDNLLYAKRCNDVKHCAPMPEAHFQGFVVTKPQANPILPQSTQNQKSQ